MCVVPQDISTGQFQISNIGIMLQILLYKFQAIKSIRNTIFDYLQRKNSNTFSITDLQFRHKSSKQKILFTIPPICKVLCSFCSSDTKALLSYFDLNTFDTIENFRYTKFGTVEIKFTIELATFQFILKLFQVPKASLNNQYEQIYTYSYVFVFIYTRSTYVCTSIYMYI